MINRPAIHPMAPQHARALASTAAPASMVFATARAPTTRAPRATFQVGGWGPRWGGSVPRLTDRTGGSRHACGALNLTRVPNPLPFSVCTDVLQRWNLQRPQHLQLHGHRLHRPRLLPARWAAETWPAVCMAHGQGSRPRAPRAASLRAPPPHSVALHTRALKLRERCVFPGPGRKRTPIPALCAPQSGPTPGA
jgi:hypothetical protein